MHCPLNVKVFALLWSKIGSHLPTFRDNLSVPSSSLILEYGIDRLSGNVDNYYYTLRKIQEERRKVACCRRANNSVLKEDENWF